MDGTSRLSNSCILGACGVKVKAGGWVGSFCSVLFCFCFNPM